MALRTSPAGDLYLPPPTPFLFMLSSFQALITFSIFISVSMLLNTTYNLPLKHIFIPMQRIMGALWVPCECVTFCIIHQS